MGIMHVSSWWNPEDVWEDSAVMVQHMRDNPDNAHITDSTQYDNDGTKLNPNEPIETASGKIDSAQNFDGSNDIITIINVESLQFNNKLTVEFWANAYSSDINWDVAIKRNTDWATFYNGWNIVFWLNNKITLWWGDGTYPLEQLWSINNYYIGTMHHYAATLDGSTARIYIDGLIDVEASQTKIMSGNTDRNLLLQIHNILDEVRIYNSRLNPLSGLKPTTTAARIHY